MPTMVVYEDQDVFPASREAIWKLLAAHRDDGTIGRIHALMRGQTTVSSSDAESVVDRVIDVRGKAMRSRWKLSYRPPEYSRWEIVESEGPWAKGSYIENWYSEAPGGTMMRSKGELRVSVLPFFMSQMKTIRKVFGDIQDEDIAFLRANP